MDPRHDGACDVSGVDDIDNAKADLLEPILALSRCDLDFNIYFCVLIRSEVV